MKCSSKEIKEVISTGLCSFILHPQYYFLFSIFTYPYPFYWMVGVLAWLIPGKIFHWCLVTMKMSSLDTEVMATALHPVAICALCVLHHFEIRLVQSINFSMLPFNKPSVSFGINLLPGFTVFLKIPTTSHWLIFLFRCMTAERKIDSRAAPFHYINRKWL